MPRTLGRIVIRSYGLMSYFVRWLLPAATLKWFCQKSTSTSASCRRLADGAQHLGLLQLPGDVGERQDRRRGVVVVVGAQLQERLREARELRQQGVERAVVDGLRGELLLDVRMHAERLDARP